MDGVYEVDPVLIDWLIESFIDWIFYSLFLQLIGYKVLCQRCYYDLIMFWYQKSNQCKTTCTFIQHKYANNLTNNFKSLLLHSMGHQF